MQNVLLKIKIPGIKNPAYYLYISLALLLAFTISMYIEEHSDSSMIPTYCLALSTYFCELLYLAHDPEPLWFIYTENFFKIMKEILGKKTFLSLIWIAVVKSGVSISFGTYAPFILKERGFTLSQIGFIVTLFSF